MWRVAVGDPALPGCRHLLEKDLLHYRRMMMSQMAFIGARKDLVNHLLNLMFILSLLFTVTVGASGADYGAPSCHSGSRALSNHADSEHVHAPQFKRLCTCDCPCCSYLAHLIPLSPPVVTVQPDRPARQYHDLAVDCTSLVIAPLIRPPNT